MKIGFGHAKFSGWLNQKHSEPLVHVRYLNHGCYYLCLWDAIGGLAERMIHILKNMWLMWRCFLTSFHHSVCESQQLNWVIAVNPIINSTQWTAWVASSGYGLYIMLLLVLLALHMKNIIRATNRKHILWSTMNLTLNPFTYMDKDSQKWVKRNEQNNTTKDLERHNIYSNFKTSSSS